MSFQVSFVTKRITQLDSERATLSTRLNVLRSQKVVNPFLVRELQTKHNSICQQISNLRGHAIPDIIA